MAGLLGGFVRMMKQKCGWAKRMSVNEFGATSWGEVIDGPCIFFPLRHVTDGRSGGAMVTPSSFYVKSGYGVSVGDKIEFRTRVYIVEEIKDIDWFGGVHDGYKCLCRQEGGVPQ